MALIVAVQFFFSSFPSDNGGGRIYLTLLEIALTPNLHLDRSPSFSPSYQICSTTNCYQVLFSLTLFLSYFTMKFSAIFIMLFLFRLNTYLYHRTLLAFDSWSTVSSKFNVYIRPCVIFLSGRFPPHICHHTSFSSLQKSPYYSYLDSMNHY